jgi:hypothetical protein
MPVPSHFLGAGNSPLSTGAVFGGGATVTGAGTTAADATAITTGSLITLAGASNTGVKLPPTEVGMEFWFRNDTGNTIKLYPYSTATTINAAQASLDIATAKTVVVKAITSTTLASITAAS